MQEFIIEEISMALPGLQDTPQTRRRMRIVEEAGDNILGDWPWPQEHDLRLFGGYINLYSCVDFEFLRLLETLQSAGLNDVISIKPANMTISDVERALVKMPAAIVDVAGIERLIEYRGVRNLLAHFVIRRFPKDDAYLFTTKSVRDFKRQIGRDPLPNELMVFHIDRDTVVRQAAEVFAIHNAMVLSTNKLAERYGIT